MTHSMVIFVVASLAFIGGSLGQWQNLLSTDEASLQKASESIPGLNTSALPVEEAKTAFKKKCETNGGPEAYTRAENAIREIQECVKDLVNVTKLQDQIEKAKPDGSLDSVFKEYCNKSPIVKSCAKNFTTSVESCFTPQERENLRIVQNITDSLLSFVCFKEGDRIALFIAAHGPECFVSKQSAIQDCLNSTFGSYVPADAELTASSATSLDNLPLLLLDTKECTDIEKLQTCVVNELEKCEDLVPGNIVDSLFNFIKRVTPCENLLSKARAEASIREEAKSAGSSIIGHNLIVSALWFFNIYWIGAKLNFYV